MPTIRKPWELCSVGRKTILRSNDFTALYDKGYHTGSELAIADAMGIAAIVAIPTFSGASHAPDQNYDVEHFEYDPKAIPIPVCRDTP